MCLIIHREPGQSGRGSNLPNAVIDYNRTLNPDGFGIAWREPNGELRSFKFGPDEFNEFRDLLKEIDRDTSTEYVAHFRRATHGPACTRLSHPFAYEDKKDGDVLVFHNGIIPIDTEPHESDTSRFVDEILKDLKPRWWANRALRYLVEEAIGYSRILVMTAQETVRLNPKLWDTDNGIHYSTWPYPSRSKVVGNTHGSRVPVVYSGGVYSGNTPSSGKGQTISTPVDSSAKGSSVIDWPAMDADDQWTSQGHTVTPLGEAKKDSENDIYGTAVCEQCHTIGDYYIIEGKVYLDVNHFFQDEPDEEGLISLPTGTVARNDRIDAAIQRVA